MGKKGKAPRLGSDTCKSETEKKSASLPPEREGGKAKLSNAGAVQPVLKRWKPKAQSPFQACPGEKTVTA